MPDHIGQTVSDFPDATHKVVQTISSVTYDCYFGSQAECDAFVAKVNGGDESDLTLRDHTSIQTEEV
jgi:hypothetical protein